jgi:hypothetical protein
MKFNDTEGKFPRFKHYLVFDFGKIADNKNIMDGLTKWGKMSGEQARSYIIPGSGPEIKIVNDADDFPSKRIADFPFSINMPNSLVLAFELKDMSRKVFAVSNDGHRIYRVGLLILELLIQGHLFKFSSDDDDRGIGRVTAAQLSFEQEVYGGINERS